MFGFMEWSGQDVGGDEHQNMSQSLPATLQNLQHHSQYHSSTPLNMLKQPIDTSHNVFDDWGGLVSPSASMSSYQLCSPTHESSSAFSFGAPDSAMSFHTPFPVDGVVWRAQQATDPPSSAERAQYAELNAVNMLGLDSHFSTTVQSMAPESMAMYFSPSLHSLPDLMHPSTNSHSPSLVETPVMETLSLPGLHPVPEQTMAEALSLGKTQHVRVSTNLPQPGYGPNMDLDPRTWDLGTQIMPEQRHTILNRVPEVSTGSYPPPMPQQLTDSIAQDHFASLPEPSPLLPSSPQYASGLEQTPDSSVQPEAVYASFLPQHLALPLASIMASNSVTNMNFPAATPEADFAVVPAPDVRAKHDMKKISGVVVGGNCATGKGGSGVAQVSARKKAKPSKIEVPKITSESWRQHTPRVQSASGSALATKPEALPPSPPSMPSGARQGAGKPSRHGMLPAEKKRKIVEKGQPKSPNEAYASQPRQPDDTLPSALLEYKLHLLSRVEPKGHSTPLPVLPALKPVAPAPLEPPMVPMGGVSGSESHVQKSAVPSTKRKDLPQTADKETAARRGRPEMMAKVADTGTPSTAAAASAASVEEDHQADNDHCRTLQAGKSPKKGSKVYRHDAAPVFIAYNPSDSKRAQPSPCQPARKRSRTSIAAAPPASDVAPVLADQALEPPGAVPASDGPSSRDIPGPPTAYAFSQPEDIGARVMQTNAQQHMLMPAASTVVKQARHAHSQLPRIRQKAPLQREGGEGREGAEAGRNEDGYPTELKIGSKGRGQNKKVTQGDGTKGGIMPRKITPVFPPAIPPSAPTTSATSITYSKSGRE